ncbi:phosphatase PAP2 family protein [Seleniivibrio woodruffii]|uniref:phosphatase PAP2 family protein n=1 Tax=Seleniivibrio woodruffii TaxID=1078050 RepID=UPI0026ECB9D6|nr:phosphatase PAP2 family protein [Seleniivibrio woodruffii]
MPAKKLISLLILLSIACAVSIIFLDVPVAGFFKSHENKVFFRFSADITELGKSDVYIPVSLGVWLIFRKRKPLIAKIALSIFLTVVIAGLASNLSKFFFGRNRPVMLYDFDTYGFEYFHTKYYKTSFPSGHTTVAAALGSMLALHWRKLTFPAAVFIILMAVTRLATLNHFLSDTLAGMVLGIGTSLLIYKKMFPQKRL